MKRPRMNELVKDMKERKKERKTQDLLLLLLLLLLLHDTVQTKTVNSYLYVM